MRIAITTWINACNFGTYYQLYGLYHYISALGHEVKVVNYKPQKEDLLRKGFDFYIAELARKIRVSIFGSSSKQIDLHKYDSSILERKVKYKEAYSKIGYTQEVKKEEEFKQLVGQFDCFVVGSDQVWNPSMLNRRYLLDYVPQEKIKASYAPSCGTSTFYKSQLSKFKQYLSSFNYISTRELALARKLTEVLGREVSHVMDPSMLIPKEYYIETAKLPTYVEPNKYIYCYFPQGRMMEDAYSLAEKEGLKIVVHLVMAEDYAYEGVSYSIAEGPEEIVGLIKNARYVLTSSYHCTLFSLRFNKELFVYERVSSGKSNDTSVRYKELIDLFNLRHRFLGVDQRLRDDGDMPPIDFDSVNRLFEQRVSDSKNYLGQFC